MKKLLSTPHPFRGLRLLVLLAVVGCIPFSITNNKHESYSSFRASAAFWSVSRDVYDARVSWSFQSPIVEKVYPALEAGARRWLEETPSLEPPLTP